jgi:hypothetical protein
MEIDVQPTNTIQVDTIDPETRNVGINGGRVGYLPNGDLVEVVQSEDEERKPVEWPMLLRRNLPDILKAYNEYRDMVWWHRHQSWLYELETGEKTLTEAEKPILERAKKAARRIERKYGRKNLEGESDGMVWGRLSALAWVLGAEWEESTET